MRTLRLRFVIVNNECGFFGVRDDADGMKIWNDFDRVGEVWIKIEVHKIATEDYHYNFLKTPTRISLKFGILIPFSLRLDNTRQKPKVIIRDWVCLSLFSPHLHTIVNWISLMYQDRFDKNLLLTSFTFLREIKFSCF